MLQIFLGEVLQMAWKRPLQFEQGIISLSITRELQHAQIPSSFRTTTEDSSVLAIVGKQLITVNSWSKQRLEIEDQDMQNQTTSGIYYIILKYIKYKWNQWWKMNKKNNYNFDKNSARKFPYTHESSLSYSSHLLCL